MAPLVPTFVRDGTGCEASFERLYQRYAGDVYRYALALLRNPADAEDATQTTFLNAYRAMQRGEEPRRPQNWLIAIAHNACRKRFAYVSRRVREVPLDEWVTSLSVPEDERPNVVGVLDALGRLPFNQRAALVMRELEGRSYSEIAETLGITRSAVEALLFRGRRSLKVKAASLRSLTFVPLPDPLTRLLDDPATFAGGGAAAAGSAGLVAKLAAVLAVGAVAGGGFVIAHPPGKRSSRSAADAAAVPLVRPAARLFSLPSLRGHDRRISIRAATGKAAAQRSTPGSVGAAETLPEPDLPGEGSASTGAASTSAAPTATTDQVSATVASVAPRLALPPVPSLPVSPPSALPQAPSLPVSTPTVTLPTVP